MLGHTSSLRTQTRQTHMSTQEQTLPDWDNNSNHPISSASLWGIKEMDNERKDNTGTSTIGGEHS
eukprot:1159467-Pelagomonas_calceolata.AAC.1